MTWTTTDSAHTRPVESVPRGYTGPNAPRRAGAGITPLTTSKHGQNERMDIQLRMTPPSDRDLTIVMNNLTITTSTTTKLCLKMRNSAITITSKPPKSQPKKYHTSYWQA